jgi:hypothetical protein
MRSVYSVVRTGYLNKAVCASSLKKFLDCRLTTCLYKPFLSFWHIQDIIKYLDKEQGPERKRAKRKEGLGKESNTEDAENTQISGLFCNANFLLVTKQFQLNFILSHVTFMSS